MPQYVLCKFRIADTRTFTYLNDGAPVEPGDQVKVPDKSGEGWKRVYVADVSDTPPADLPKGVALKAIIGKIEPEASPADVASAMMPANTTGNLPLGDDAQS